MDQLLNSIFRSVGSGKIIPTSGIGACSLAGALKGTKSMVCGAFFGHNSCYMCAVSKTCHDVTESRVARSLAYEVYKNQYQDLYHRWDNLNPFKEVRPLPFHGYAPCEKLIVVQSGHWGTIIGSHRNGHIWEYLEIVGSCQVSGQKLAAYW